MATSLSKPGGRQDFASTGSVPVGQRLAHDIVKPKDWGAFQRNCVVLFREELRDPNAKEYGRNGQDQGGIDILGHRDPVRAVGVQCRLIQKSLKRAKLLADCRAALALSFGLKEIIFATTAPNDTKAEQAAKAVKRAPGRGSRRDCKPLRLGAAPAPHCSTRARLQRLHADLSGHLPGN